jgi:hypothetical protein
VVRGKNDETENELLICDGFGERNAELKYSWIFGSSVSKMGEVASAIEKRLKMRKSLLEEEPG